MNISLNIYIPINSVEEFIGLGILDETRYPHIYQALEDEILNEYLDIDATSKKFLREVEQDFEGTYINGHFVKEASCVFSKKHNYIQVEAFPAQLNDGYEIFDDEQVEISAEEYIGEYLADLLEASITYPLKEAA